MKPSTMKSDWVKITPEEIGKLVVEMNKEGMNVSQIGTKLRDEYAVSSIKAVTGKKMNATTGFCFLINNSLYDSL